VQHRQEPQDHHGHRHRHGQEQQTKIDMLERDKQILHHKVLASQQEQKMDLTKTIDSLKGQLESFRAQVNNLQQWREEHEHEYAHNNNPSMVHAHAALQEQNTPLEQQLNTLPQQHRHEAKQEQERVVASIQQDLAGIAHKLSVFDNDNDNGSSKENESDKPWTYCDLSGLMGNVLHFGPSEAPVNNMVSLSLLSC
jgi:hypothetical protein